jgi:hypothetical protein
MERTNRIYCECDPVVNTKYFCTFDDVDADLARGMGGVAQKGPMSQNCAIYNKLDCSKNWDDRCRFLANDARPKRTTSTSLMGYDNGSFSQGEDLVVESARTRFCNVTGGVIKSFNVLDYTDCTLNVTDQFMGYSFECNQEPKDLDNDPLFNEMINRRLGNDIVLNLYKNAINNGKNVKGTLLERRVNEIASTQRFDTSFLRSGLGNRSIYAPFN